MVNSPTTQASVTKAMIEAARMAEYRHYYGDRSPTSHTWAGTPVMVISKMIQAALDARKNNDG